MSDGWGYTGVGAVLLAKIVLATRDDGPRKWLAADKAGKRQIGLCLLGNLKLPHVHRRLSRLQLAVNLPATLIVAAVVQELAIVAKSTESRLLVVLANVGLVVPAHRRANV